MDKYVNPVFKGLTGVLFPSAKGALRELRVALEGLFAVAHT